MPKPVNTNDLVSEAAKSGRYSYNPHTGVIIGPRGHPLTNHTLTFKGHRLLTGRVIWTMHHGFTPGDFLLDHINGDRYDNRISNLRLLTHRQSQLVQPVPSPKRNRKHRAGYFHYSMFASETAHPGARPRYFSGTFGQVYQRLKKHMQARSRGLNYAANLNLQTAKHGDTLS